MSAAFSGATAARAVGSDERCTHAGCTQGRNAGQREGVEQHRARTRAHATSGRSPRGVWAAQTGPQEYTPARGPLCSACRRVLAACWPRADWRAGCVLAACIRCASFSRPRGGARFALSERLMSLAAACRGRGQAAKIRRTRTHAAKEGRRARRVHERGDYMREDGAARSCQCQPSTGTLYMPLSDRGAVGPETEPPPRRAGYCTGQPCPPRRAPLRRVARPRADDSIAPGRKRVGRARAERTTSRSSMGAVFRVSSRDATSLPTEPAWVMSLLVMRATMVTRGRSKKKAAHGRPQPAWRKTEIFARLHTCGWRFWRCSPPNCKLAEPGKGAGPAELRLLLPLSSADFWRGQTRATRSASFQRNRYIQRAPNTQTWAAAARPEDAARAGEHQLQPRPRCRCRRVRSGRPCRSPTGTSRCRP